MVKKAYLYCDHRSLNDATIYYVGIIKDCLIESGYDYAVVHKLSEIKNPNVILTITERYYFLAKIRFPKVKTIYWAQGVGAEEAKCQSKGLSGFLRYHLRLYTENMAVNKCDLLFCVSKKMEEYFKGRYGLNNLEKSIIIPCYNLPLSNIFDNQQYVAPTFCYAGGSSVWQGIDFMLEVYRLVEDKLPSSKLIICTGDKLNFKRKIEEYGIRNYDIKYVPVNQLQDELHKYKYGFILRDDHIVNQVATPTKMNSYLANYMIPIYSASVQDFRDNLNLGEFRIMAEMPLNSIAVANKIIDFENSEHDFSKYRSVVERIFDEHYNDGMYKTRILQMLKNCL